MTRWQFEVFQLPLLTILTRVAARKAVQSWTENIHGWRMPSGWSSDNSSQNSSEAPMWCTMTQVGQMFAHPRALELQRPAILVHWSKRRTKYDSSPLLYQKGYVYPQLDIIRWGSALIWFVHCLRIIHCWYSNLTSSRCSLNFRNDSQEFTVATVSRMMIAITDHRHYIALSFIKSDHSFN